MARREQIDDVWDAVLKAWYPGGVPARKNSPVRAEVNGAVEDLRGQGVTGEEITLWVLNCKAAIKKTTWPESGCSLHTCVTKFAQFRPGELQILQHRFDKWKGGLPPEFQTYVRMHGNEAEQCWLGGVGAQMANGDPLKDAARKEWKRLDGITKHHSSLKDKVVPLRDEVGAALAKYLPKGEGDAG